MALVLGLLVSAGLYFAYLWPSVEPDDDDDEDDEAAAVAAAEAASPDDKAERA